MASDAIEVEGIVKDVLWWGKYQVYIEDMDMEVEAYAAGKMKKFRIKIIPGDIVQVELNPYEPTKWRITYRSINRKVSKRPQRKIPSVPVAKKPVAEDTPPPSDVSKKDT